VTLGAKARPLILFGLAYLAYTASLLLAVGPVASTACLLLMVAAVVWAGRLRDEVLRGVAARAYQFAFWVGFFALYLEATAPGSWIVRGGWPLWTAPLLAWVLAYGWSLWRLR
jgi:hypothetical protein